uniref:Tax1 (human T-cell leukemia virus type I) binding protein 1a n=1 Tax=Neogobius melanostomus TaxID=47308 RepID=A0A8C6V2G6_9GOBI
MELKWFVNVGKSFLPQVPLECSYTLTPYLSPHPKDWVGIFKVGWSTARDYYTFLWSPMPENYEAGSTVHRTVVFQGNASLTSPSPAELNPGEKKKCLPSFYYSHTATKQRELLKGLEGESDSDRPMFTCRDT